MISDELEKESTKLEKYLEQQGRESLIRELRSLDKTHLLAKTLEYAKYRQDILDFKANDKELQDTTKKKAELMAPHTENLRMNDKIARFINFLLKEKSDG